MSKIETIIDCILCVAPGIAADAILCLLFRDWIMPMGMTPRIIFAILCGALFVAISTIAYKRIADLRASEVGFTQHYYVYDTLKHMRTSEEDKT